MTNNPNMSIAEYLARGYIQIECNQDFDKVTFASNYVKELVERYIKTVIKNKSQIEKNVTTSFVSSHLSL